MGTDFKDSAGSQFERAFGLQAMLGQCGRLGEGIDFVQGAGGNLSFKDEHVLLIKASGTRLKDADKRQIFIDLPLALAREQVLHREDLSDLVISQTDPPLRPSIETAIHSLLPHTFVSHVHSVGAISRAINRENETARQSLSDLGNVVFVSYAKPGIPLAHAILNSLSSAELLPTETLIIILGNHGVIVAAGTSEKVEETLTTIESRWRGTELTQFSNSRVTKDGYFELAPAGSLNPRQSKLLAGGVLTPDQVVFLGTKPFRVDSDHSSESRVVINADGSVRADSSLGEDAIEIAQSFVHIAQCTEETCSPSYLSGDQIEELINWDAEKWRKAQER